ncbi:hypothetical protein OG885_42620 [Streptomyces sp. NBC_00028]|uniref:hypothetical protein n=1 Tax=Streptomyces sp. NBC_00028 TaxID=2975624 RepID=UPI003252B4CC
MDRQLVGAVQEHRVAVAAVQVGDRAPALDPARTAGDTDHVLDHDVLGQEVEEVLRLDQAGQALLDDPEERLQGREVLMVPGGVVVGHGHIAAVAVQAWAWRRANSWKVVALRPVTFSMSSLGVAVARADGPGRPAEHHRVVGGRPGGDGAADPRLSWAGRCAPPRAA